MLVFVSDLHLTDGTGGHTLPAGALELFTERLGDLALRASWRADGGYRPIERIDLVLLGDVLDLLRSARWLGGSVRPWHEGETVEMLETVELILEGILAENADSLDLLRRLREEPPIAVPPALRNGQPAPQGSDEPIPVNIYYMVGNHDWMLHLPGGGAQRLRRLVVEQLGLAQDWQTPFPHDPAECPVLLEVLRRHRVWARHGDLFDPLNYAGDRDTSAVGDAVVIELVTRFADQVRRQMADELPDALLWGLDELDNVRPLILIPAWIDGLLERYCPFPAVCKQIKKTWDSLVDEFLQLNILRRQDTWSPLDWVDNLERTLKFSKRLSTAWAGRAGRWLSRLRGEKTDSYYVHALREPDFRNRRARHIVYGHTHAAESVPLDASFADGYVLNQMYFNTGTWRRCHRQTRLLPEQNEFIATENITITTFYAGDERGGRALETWSGTLGIAATSKTLQHRIDSGSHTHASPQPVPPSKLHLATPHFDLSADPSRTGVRN